MGPATPALPHRTDEEPETRAADQMVLCSAPGVGAITSVPSPAGGPATSAIAAAMAGSPPVTVAATQAIQVLTDLQARGFELLEQRRFHVPFLQKPQVAVTPQQFLERLDQGSSRLRIGGHDLDPVQVASRSDLDALDAFYLSGAVAALPQASLAGALNALYLRGCRFQDGKRDVGPYGAYRALTRSQERLRPLVLSSDNQDASTLATPEDAARLRFFRVDRVADGLSAPVQAQTLRDLGDGKARFWAGPDDTMGFTADVAYQRLFQSQPPEAVWAGNDEAPLLPLASATLATPAVAVQQYETAVQAYASLTSCGIGDEERRHAWEAVRDPVAGENFDQRLQWLSAMSAAQPQQRSATVEDYESLRKALRPGESFDEAVQDFVTVRPWMDTYDHESALAAVDHLRNLDTVLPGAEPRNQKRMLYLSLLEALSDPAQVETTWKALGGHAPRAERVAVFKSLAETEHRSVASAQNDFDAIVSLQRQGETLTDAAAAFQDVRSQVGTYDSEDGRAAFRFVRRDLDASLPGPWSPQQRDSMFHSILDRIGSAEEAIESWRFLTGETRSKHPAPSADFPERVQGLLALIDAEQGNARAAQMAMETVLSHRNPGESIHDAVAAYLDLRGRVSKYDSEQGRAAFEFVRAGMDAAIGGSLTPDTKKEMYLQLLTALESHEAALDHWERLAGKGQPPADMPQRLEAFMALGEVENGNFDRAQEALAAVLGDRRTGESLETATQDYIGLRDKVGKWDTDDAVELYHFMRHDLTASLPGTWSEAERRTMYLKLLEATGNHASALSIWENLSGVTKKTPNATPPADFPEVLDAFVTLVGVENGQADRAVAPLAALRNASGGSLGDRVAEYLALRPLVGLWDTEAGVSLYQFVHDSVPAAQRDLYLKVQGASNEFDTAQAAWQHLRPSDPGLGERVDVLIALTRDEPSGGLAVADKQMACLLAHARSGETLEDTRKAFAEVRKCHGPWEGEQAIADFVFLREKVGDTRAGAFLQLVSQAGLSAQPIFEALEGFGSGAGFDRRLQILMATPSDEWLERVGVLKGLEKRIPPGVDSDRVGTALFAIVNLDGGESLVTGVLSRFEREKGASLEWLCQVMEAAGSMEAFDRGLRLTNATGGSGNGDERREVLTRFLEGGRGSQGVYDTALAMLERLIRLPAPEFAEISSQAVSFVEAMRGHAGDALKAFERILDMRGQGLLAAIPLDAVLADFATQYATTQNVDRALARLEQDVHSGALTIEDRDDVLIIGGVRVPRKEKTADA